MTCPHFRHSVRTMAIVFQRIGGMMTTQVYPAILLQIERRENSIRRMLLSTPTRHYAEHFIPIPSPSEASDIQWISLVHGIRDAILMKERTVHIQMDNPDIVHAILTKNIPTESINTKYYNRMFMDWVAKTEWTGLRVCAMDAMDSKK